MDLRRWVDLKKFQPAIAGLGAAALVAWLACPAPPHGLFTPGRALRASVVYLVAIATACLVGAFIAERNRSHRASRLRALTAIAIWFAPAAVLLASRTTFAIYPTSQSTLEAIAVLLIPASLWWLDRPQAPPDLAYAGEMFALPHTTRLMRQLPVSIGLALLAELIATLVISEELFVATLLGVAGAVVFWRTLSWLPQENRLILAGHGPASHIPVAPHKGRALTTAIAVTLTLAGLSRFVALPMNSGGAGAASAGAERQEDAGNPAPPAESDTGAGVGEFTGVILIPDVEKHVTLVPPLPSMRSELFRSSDDNPLTIPFYGVYWFYRFPALRPPATSVTLHGKPEDIRFRSTGYVPLKMEAHQNLGKLIDVSCCSRIQVAIHNAEQLRSTHDHPELGRVQLILANTTGRDGPSESLGMQSVDGSEHQLVDFPLHSNVQLRQFDELTVRILRGWTMSQSARISVERFVLVPRGRF